MGIFKTLFGIGSSEKDDNMRQLLAGNAAVLDVRTVTEFQQGHLEGS